MTNPPVLALQNLGKQFIVEIDASSGGIGATLIKEGHLIAFSSKSFRATQQALSIYEKRDASHSSCYNQI